MKVLPILRTLVVIAAFAFTAFAQQPSVVKPEPTPSPTPDENAEKIKQEAVNYIRVTLRDVDNMRTSENRIGFTAELASLLWDHDQREATAMFSSVVNEFKSLLSRYDMQLNAFEMAGQAKDVGGGLFGAEPTEYSRVIRKARMAAAVRQQIAMSLADHVPELALNFFNDSGSIVTNEKLKSQISAGDEGFEFRLISRIAETNLARAVELSEDGLKKGLNYNHISLLRRIYEKDQDKGIAFGAKVLAAFKATDRDKIQDYLTSSFLSFGVENSEAAKNDPAKKPIYSEADLREIAEIFAASILKDGDVYNRYSALSYATVIEKVLPARAAQIRAKYPDRTEAAGRGRVRNTTTFSVEAPPPAMPGGRSGATAVGTGGGDIESPSQKETDEMKMMENMNKLGNKELPKEERDKIVAEARKLIEGNTSREAKVTALSLLAAQVKKAGDGQLASELMLDASRQLNPSAKHMREMMLTWILISGYAETEPDKAFGMIETTIFRVNELLAAMATVGEFVDVNEEMFVDGEMQVGAFGGDMVRGITSSLGMAESTVSKLVAADFDRSRAMTDRFDRVETRVLAKMILLRTILGKKDEKKNNNMMLGF